MDRSMSINLDFSGGKRLINIINNHSNYRNAEWEKMTQNTDT